MTKDTHRRTTKEAPGVAAAALTAHQAKRQGLGLDLDKKEEVA